MLDSRPDGPGIDMASSNENNPPASRRRSLLKGLAIAGGVVSAATMRPSISKATQSQPPTPGDIAVLSLLAAAELIEADLWQQYAELGGVTIGTQNPYQLALQNLDPDGSQYITSNTTDEQSHATFLNAYLASIGAEPVNLDKFRTLQGSQATGAAGIGRLTNLMQLKVDTSWYTRYRSSTSPDFGATFPQALPALFAGRFTAIPQTDADFSNGAHIQAIANTAAFHFGAIEQAGSSLYAAMSQRVTGAEVLEITLGIGGDETCHYPGMGRLLGQRRAAARRSPHRSDQRLDVPQLQRATQSPTADQSHLPGTIPVHQRRSTALFSDPPDHQRWHHCHRCH